MPGTVTIACKLPNGLHLNVFRMEPSFESVMGGGVRETVKAVPAGRITLRGAARRLDDPRVVGGYALTPNVDADLWEAWLKANKDADVVKNGLIFAQGKHADAASEAHSRREVRNGLEEIDPQSLPGEFKRKIETATRAS